MSGTNTRASVTAPPRVEKQSQVALGRGGISDSPRGSHRTQQRCPRWIGIPGNRLFEQHVGLEDQEVQEGRASVCRRSSGQAVHHLNSTPPPPTRYLPMCTQQLETLILEFLEKEPEARPTAVHAAGELRSIRANLSGGRPLRPLTGLDGI